jgi:biotin carboxylase
MKFINMTPVTKAYIQRLALMIEDACDAQDEIDIDVLEEATKGIAVGTRHIKTREEWQEELAYIRKTAKSKNFKSFNNDPDCFGRYVAMQAEGAAYDDCSDLGEWMLEAAEYEGIETDW